MWKRLQALWPGRAVLGRLVRWPGRATLGKMIWVGGVVFAGVLAFFWGYRSALSQAPTPRPTGPMGVPQNVQMAPGGNPSDLRVVAYLRGYGNMPITREELGEYLITRLGAERLQYLINRKVIDLVCAQRGIVISDAEIDAQFQDDLKGFNVSEKDFVNVLLKRRGQSLFEYKEDVIRPRLQMTRFCRDNVKVTDEDLQKGFEAKYGDKVECKMIVLSPEQFRNKDKIYMDVRDNDAEFDKWAGQSCVPAVASAKGKIPPIHRHYPDEKIERAAFSLLPGQVSAVIEMPDHCAVILKCVKQISGDNNMPDLMKNGALRKQLFNEIYEAKVPSEIQRVFKLLREQADPQIFLRHDITRQEFDRAMQNNLQTVMPTGKQP